MRNPTRTVVRHRAAELVFCHFFMRDRLDDVRTGHKHIAGLVHHDDEICDGGRVHGSAGTRSHNRGDLGDDS